MPCIVDQVTLPADGMHMKSGARDDGAAISFENDQRPVRSTKQVEQPQCLARCSTDRGIGCPVAGQQAARAFGLLQRQTRFRIADVELVHVAAASPLAALHRIEQAGQKTEHHLRDRPPFFLITVEQRRRRTQNHEDGNKFQELGPFPRIRPFPRNRRSSFPSSHQERRRAELPRSWQRD